jgi:exopolysaccharide biosynthesis protein
MKKTSFLMFIFFVLHFVAQGQIKWRNVDTLFAPLPSSVHIFYTEDKLDTGAFKAYYVTADLSDKKLDFTTDTTYHRRLTPSALFEKNSKPLLVVNGTFFSFQTNSNLNLVMKEGKVLAQNPPLKQLARDSTTELFIYGSALGIDKKRKADIAWVMADSTMQEAYASQVPTNSRTVKNGKHYKAENSAADFTKWNVKTAIGGGPVLVQDGKIKITNEIERKFRGKAINDKHPRTAMGYTADGKLMILVVEGRNASASGATLGQLATLLIELGCIEALNLDGGGSSCLLLNGKETIRPSDKEGQRPIPGVFIIRQLH